MNETYRRFAPVLASIAIFIVIAVLRERSRALAAITATMPINITLALWIISVSDGTDHKTVVSFVRSMFIGIVGTLIWLLVVWLAARAGGPCPGSSWLDISPGGSRSAPSLPSNHSLEAPPSFPADASSATCVNRSYAGSALLH